jgi:hypothetical protein
MAVQQRQSPTSGVGETLRRVGIDALALERWHDESFQRWLAARDLYLAGGPSSRGHAHEIYPDQRKARESISRCWDELRRLDDEEDEMAPSDLFEQVRLKLKLSAVACSYAWDQYEIEWHSEEPVSKRFLAEIAVMISGYLVQYWSALEYFAGCLRDGRLVLEGEATQLLQGEIRCFGFIAHVVKGAWEGNGHGPVDPVIRRLCDLGSAVSASRVPDPEEQVRLLAHLGAVERKWMGMDGFLETIVSLVRWAARRLGR